MKSLNDLPDYKELIQRIADMTASLEVTSTYLYEKDVYNPEDDVENEEIATADATPDEQSDTSGFELPDFLSDSDEDVIKIQ